MARAQQMVGPLFVEGDGAAHVGADLGVGNDALVIPTVTLLRPDVTRSHAHEDDRGLCAGIHVLLELLDLFEIFRDGGDESADRQVLGPNRHEAGVGDDTEAVVPECDRQQIRRARAAGRCRPKITQHEDEGDREQRHGTDERAPDELVAGESRLRLATLVVGEGLLVGRCRRGEFVTVLDDLYIGHELLGPLNRAGPDEKDCCTEGETEHEGAGTDISEYRNVDRRGLVDRDVRDDEGDGEEHRQQEHGGDLPLGPPCRLGIGVGHAKGMRDVGNRGVAQAFRLAAVRIVRGDVAHRALIPIQMAAPMRAAKTAVQRNRPSVTGPSRPRERPPGFDATWSSLT
ncbi:unannotated protein [freshwater metagenome]|uniref:Unannotated protein n=1 Tax=freshwater metagenome TaxID=449393 RepID=A0A6J7R395_9ZZZZ